MKKTALEQPSDRSLDVPSRLPGSWFEHVDRTEIDRLIRHATHDATEKFFERLNTSSIPGEPELRTATTAMGQFLHERVASVDWIETLCGTKTELNEQDSKEQEYLKLHLQELLLPPEVPAPTLMHMELRPIILAVVAALGSILGAYFGGLLPQLHAAFTAESGILVGAPLGAALTTAGCALLARNEFLRKRLLMVLGIAGAVDAALQILKGFLPWPTGGKISFVKRLLCYLALGLILVFVRSEKRYDLTSYRKELESILTNWLYSALNLIAVLTFKIQNVKENPFVPNASDTSALREIVELADKFRKGPKENLPLLLDELLQELASNGFEIAQGEMTPSEDSEPQTTSNSKESGPVWSEEMKERYKPMGIIRDGDPIRIVEEPVIRNGIIEQLGIARKNN